MDLFTQVLDKFGIKDFDQLNSLEQETLRGWVDKVEKSQITLEDVKHGVATMRETVEAELARWETEDKKDIFLKARLRNLILIETILTRPEKAREALDNYISRTKVDNAV